jgi:hypothetical protein
MQSSPKLRRNGLPKTVQISSDRPEQLQNVAVHLDPLMPNDTELAEVLGFVEVLREKGFCIPLSAGGTSRFFQGSSGFLSLLTSARMLGLVSMKDHRIFLTERGLEFLNADYSEKMEILRVRLQKIEPFKTMLSLLSESKSVRLDEISRKLSSKYSMGTFDPDRTRAVLIEWGLPTHLFEYDGNNEFRLD